MSPAQQQAVGAAQDYLDFSSFSRQGLIDQLSSEYGDKFNVQDATVAVDSLNEDWNAQAVKSAKDYLDFSSFSCQGLIDQLSSQYGSKFTVENNGHPVVLAAAGPAFTRAPTAGDVGEDARADRRRCNRSRGSG